MTVATDKDAYPSSINPQITMTIASKAQADCVRDIGSSANEIKITSGDQNVWSSNDCDSSQASSRQVLTPGARAEVKLTWNRQLSDAECSPDPDSADPGAYQVQGINGNVDSDQVRFELQ